MVTLILKSGRAVLWPIYKGTYDRKTALKSNRPDTTVSYRTHVIRWSQDLGTSIDYLESRDDINSGNLAYFGFSWGAAMGAILPALENERLKASVLLIGGLFPERSWPEVDQINFAARVKIPVLMLGGKYDHNFPLEASQLPLFRTLGTPEEHKRHVVFETGHWLPEKAAFEEIVAWLDTYLGVEGQIAE